MEEHGRHSRRGRLRWRKRRRRGEGWWEQQTAEGRGKGPAVTCVQQLVLHLCITIVERTRLTTEPILVSSILWARRESDCHMRWHCHFHACTPPTAIGPTTSIHCKANSIILDIKERKKWKWTVAWSRVLAHHALAAAATLGVPSSVPPRHSGRMRKRQHQPRGPSATDTATPRWHHHPPPMAAVAGPCHADVC
jgi:hypothetical protein